MAESWTLEVLELGDEIVGVGFLYSNFLFFAADISQLGLQRQRANSAIHFRRGFPHPTKNKLVKLPRPQRQFGTPHLNGKDKMPPKKTQKPAQENISLGPQVREGALSLSQL